MPFEHEHSCRLISPDSFQPKSFRRVAQGSVSIIIGRLKGKKTTSSQSIRYPKDKWTADKAMASCEEKGGTFEAAAAEAEGQVELSSEKYQEASWQDMASLDFKEEDMPQTIEEAVLSHNDKRDRIQSAVKEKYGHNDRDHYGPYIRDVWDDSVVYEDGSKYYRVSYTIDDKGVVTLGDTKEVMVQTTYEDLGESEEIDLLGDFLALTEKGNGDIVPIKIIQPGWGSSGYYPKPVLQRDANVYKSGTKMYWNHPTATEDRERPERSLHDLAGVLTEDAEWQDNGVAGPGIYAQTKVFDGYKGAVKELAPHIGISHIASGKGQKGEAEGQKGNIIKQITAAHSVDFVTSPGAGGQVLQLFEAARGSGGIPEPIKNEEVVVTEQEAKALKERNETLEKKNTDLSAENVTLKGDKGRFEEAGIYREAGTIVASGLKETVLPELAKARLSQSLAVNPPMKEGKLDVEALKSKITEKVKDEIEYLSKVTGSGVIKGMGSVHEEAHETGDLKKSFKENYLLEGKTEDEAERLATIAATGR